MDFIPYTKQLLDPRWQKKRLEILERDEFTCQFCGDTKNTLHVHHFNYVKGGYAWDSDGCDLVTLCSTCHTINHHASLLTKQENELIGLATNMVQLHEGKNEDFNFIAQQANNIILKKLKALKNGKTTN